MDKLLWYNPEDRYMAGTTLAIPNQNLECAGLIWSQTSIVQQSGQRYHTYRMAFPP